MPRTKDNCSQTWNGVPPGVMKMQLRILRLRLKDDSAKGDDATYLQGRSFDCVWPKTRPNFAQDDKGILVRRSSSSQPADEQFALVNHLRGELIVQVDE